MTILVLGMKPTTKRGEKFGRTLRGWGELARYSIIVAPDNCAPIRYWLDPRSYAIKAGYTTNDTV